MDLKTVKPESYTPCVPVYNAVTCLATVENSGNISVYFVGVAQILSHEGGITDIEVLQVDLFFFLQLIQLSFKIRS